MRPPPMHGAALWALSLRAKLRLTIMLATLSAVVLTVAVLFAAEAMSLRASLLRDLAIDAKVMASNSAAALAFDDPVAGLETLSSLRADPRMLQGAVYTAGDRLLAAYARPGLASAPPARPPADGHRFGPGSLTLSAPVVLRGERVGTLYLEHDLGEFYAKLRRFAAAAGLILLAALAAAFLLAERFQRLVSGPILELAAAAKAITETADYSRRVSRGGADELGVLIDGFNAMLGRIQARDNALQGAREGLERQLLAANKEFESFSYSVSHDLRAPLRHIDCFSKLIEEEHAGGLDAKGRDYLGHVRRAAQRMDLLITGLLELARLARAPLHRVPVDLSALASDLAQDLKTSQPGRQAEFEIAPGVAASGDPALLRSALQNLLDNAWKFTAKHPSARIEFGLTRRDGRAVYFIKDDGAGFEMRSAKNLFSVFARLHGIGEFAGSGIGLASVKRIIERHGGSIWAEAAPEKGAAFYFTLGPEADASSSEAIARQS